MTEEFEPSAELIVRPSMGAPESMPPLSERDMMITKARADLARIEPLLRYITAEDVLRNGAEADTVKNELTKLLAASYVVENLDKEN